MTEKENEIFNLLEEVGVKYMFENVEFTIVSTLLEETTVDVSECTDLQISNFHVEKDAITKYRQESNVKSCQQAKVLLEKTLALTDRIEEIKKEITQFDAQWTETQAALSEERGHIKELELKRHHIILEKDKVVESLENTRKALRVALEMYQQYLGMQVSPDAGDQQRYVVTFTHMDDIIEKQERKVVVTKTNDGYILPDGTRLHSAAQLMSVICQERRKLTQLM